MATMTAPDSGVKVRMYRTGNGDCFLLCFRGDDGKPVYMLIDCGYYHGSQHIEGEDGVTRENDIRDVVDHISESTDGQLHVVLITHEHMDHVNGFAKKTRASGDGDARHFDSIDVDKLWLAWTEDPDDEDANDLREEFNDKLLGLLAAEEQLSALHDSTGSGYAGRVRDLLGFAVGEDMSAARTEIFSSDGMTNKRAIKYVKDKARSNKPLYLKPEKRDGYFIPNVNGVRVYALGPPRDEELLARSLDPKDGEGYSTGGNHSARNPIANSAERSFLSAALAASSLRGALGPQDPSRPFAARDSILVEEALNAADSDFYSTYHHPEADRDDNAWRRIDHDWLFSAEQLALRLDDEVNNTSLVVAIELPNTKQVLLFVGDAQRGSWVSWDDQTWVDENDNEITARDLLGRTVLYKVGHHGSHNATLNGGANSDYPNLNWMARGDYRDSFVAMITANEKWANEKQGWPHPLEAIKTALMGKAKGRVFQTDVDHVERSSHLTDEEWEEFDDASTETRLYFEYTIKD